MSEENTLRRTIGMADAFELLSCLFTFPDAHLAQGLSEGAVAEDAQSCLVDMGASEADVTTVVSALGEWQAADVEPLLSIMRIKYSELYLTPGGHTPIQPYESAFIHVERGLTSAPALFRTPVTLDVEQCMREAGVLPKNARQDPCDSVYGEFAYLSYLYVQLADALYREDEEAITSWTSHIEAFREPHAHAWLPAFMAKTREMAGETPYDAFAQLAQVVLSA